MPLFGSKEYLKEAKQKAKKIGVDVEYSKVKNKKLDVYKNNNKIGSIGDKRYSDYIQHGQDERRRLYKLRHEKDRKIKNTPGYYADKILW